MWEQLISGTLTEVTKQRMQAVASMVGNRLQSRPDVDRAMVRLGQRKADLLGIELLGVAPRRRYANVYDFFDDYLSNAYEVSDYSQLKNWKKNWWEYPSVVFRITAMWKAYEYLVLSDPARADELFLRTIGDHHMRLLLSDESPMAGNGASTKLATSTKEN